MEIIIYIIGGLLAGIATGLVGLSAATIIAPLFATILGVPVYAAIGIALASDVLASAISAGNYIRNKNIDIKSSLLLAICVIFFTVLGSYLSKDMNPYNLNGIINIFVLILGLRFIIYPVKNRAQSKVMKPGKLLIVQTIIWGAIIGMINGYFGAGGGLSILAVLTILLGYDLKRAIGTSVFIMTFTALVGASTHIIIGGTNLLPLIITCISAFIGANLSSIYANKIDEVTLNKVIGSFLVVYGILLIMVYYT
ncbi:sulfite exporter TauE/SafE family protein [Mycoplasmatota bacterium]|nr:sulfite exporter TauE/SafE family protein [Mycoplasmatota bacterium]